MCGIVGILSEKPVANDLLAALKRLEYRGYDSAGIATLEKGAIVRRRAEGKLKNLEVMLQKQPLAGHAGIGHTRWATHGKPTHDNAHPHATARVAAVHNGIVENYRELREELLSSGTNFESETDTEIVVHLVSRELDKGKSPQDAVARVLKRLRGAFALAFLFKGEEDLLIAARRGSPLAIGHGKNAIYLGSDAIALSPFTQEITYLEEGDWAVLHKTGAQVFDFNDRPVERVRAKIKAGSALVEKAPYPHFMLKEIYEQPEMAGHTLAHYLNMAEGKVDIGKLPFDFEKFTRLALSACGTAYYAALTARYWFERYAQLPVDIDIASEFRYREAPLDADGLALLISQSGETADTLATLRYCKAKQQKIGAVVNVLTSTIAREADIVFPTLAGTEIGVASTKAFTCQLIALACLSIAAGVARKALAPEGAAKLVSALIEAPRHMTEALKAEPQIKKLAKDVASARSVLYLGRGTSFPIAMEGALKMKEISYLHAEGYAAGELKHGPIALIDETMPVVVVAPYDQLFEKTLSNMQEVAARGGKVILVTDSKGAHEAGDTYALIKMPDVDSFIAPLIYAIPMQLLAYHTAALLGTDIDQPRNLAKSVTVE
jgi:glucosamine--fructose-6-phosphate aminotransferase (isomerizing)